jgi:hypothetical protein
MSCLLQRNLFVAGYVETCFECESYSYWFAFYQIYINGIGLRIVSCASLLSDIFLILNRYLEITKKSISIWKQISKKFIMFLCFSFSIIFAVPAYFAFIIEKIPNGFFIKKLSNFGISQIFNSYSIAILLFDTVIPIVIILFLNLASIYKFRKRVRIHHNLTRINENKTENRYSKLVIILTTICIISRLLDLVTNILFRFSIFNPSIFTNSEVVLIIFSVNLTNLFLFVIHAADGILYLVMDTNLSRLSLSLIGIKKVNLNCFFLLILISFKINFIFRITRLSIHHKIEMELINNALFWNFFLFMSSFLYVILCTVNSR